MKKDTFCRLPATSAQGMISTEKKPQAGMILNYDDDSYSQGYGRTKEAFRVLTKDETFNHKNLTMTLELQRSWLLMLVIIYMFSI